jgi:hypothetical protein
MCFETLQAIFAEEQRARARLHQQCGWSGLQALELSRRLELLRLERFHFAKMWLLAKSTELASCERFLRIRLFQRHSVALEELCHRLLVVEAQQADLRLVILHVAALEQNRLAVVARRWEEVFSDAYASPTRIVKNLASERAVVRRLLDVLSQAEIAPPAHPRAPPLTLTQTHRPSRVIEEGRGAKTRKTSPSPTAAWRHTYK